MSSILTGTIFFCFMKSLCLDPFNAFTFLGRGSGKRLLKVAVKDNIAVKGWPMTCASGYLKGKLIGFNRKIMSRIIMQLASSIY